MWRAVFAAALLLGCRSDPRGAPSRDDAPRSGSATIRSVVPVLPRASDGAAELRVLDRQIARARTEPHSIGPLIDWLGSRASIRGRLEDYEEAVARAADWVARAPTEPAAWTARVTTLTRVHQFAEARIALARLVPLTRDPSAWEGLAATLDEAEGRPAAATAYRERTATTWHHPANLTTWAANLAARGDIDAALALIPRAAAAVRDPSPILQAWLLFQWGRLYEQKGELAAARQLHAAAHARLPGYVDATVHLAQAMRATGEHPGALVTAALTDSAHPELLALAGQIADARREWERYLTSFAAAFADHAARFYLGPGADAARALVLARANLANRDTHEARALVVEAALAASDPPAACEATGPLIGGQRAHQFIAWRALSACGRAEDARQLAAVLGIQ